MIFKFVCSKLVLNYFQVCFYEVDHLPRCYYNYQVFNQGQVSFGDGSGQGVHARVVLDRVDVETEFPNHLCFILENTLMKSLS